MQFEKMITEGSHTASAEIDRVSTLEMCRIINDEDKTVPLAVERVLPDIAAAIDVIHAQVSGGGRLIYALTDHGTHGMGVDAAGGTGHIHAREGHHGSRGGILGSGLHGVGGGIHHPARGLVAAAQEY